MALKPNWNQSRFVIRFLIVFDSFTVGHYGVKNLSGAWGVHRGACPVACPATCPVACPQTREHSSFIVSMTLSVILAVLSYTHSLES